MNAETLEQLLRAAIAGAPWANAVSADGCSVFNADGEMFVEVILCDAAMEEIVLQRMQEELAGLGLRYSLSVKSRWHVDAVGEPVSARSTDGNIHAAALVPVVLRSGGVKEPVTVSVTKLAEQTLFEILRYRVDPRDVATAALTGELQHGGRSRRELIKHNYIEVGVSAAIGISRLLRKSA